MALPFNNPENEIIEYSSSEVNMIPRSDDIQPVKVKFKDLKVGDYFYEFLNGGPLKKVELTLMPHLENWLPHYNAIGLSRVFFQDEEIVLPHYNAIGLSRVFFQDEEIVWIIKHV
jgi:hypothetical protein